MSARRTCVVGLVQMRCDADPETNLRNALERIAEAAGRGAQVIAVPELFLGPYFCQRPDDLKAFDSAETVPGPTTRILSETARKHGVVLVGGSLFERTAQGVFYNTAPVFGPDGTMLGAYRKSHIPEDPLYHEQHYFAKGDTGIRVFDTPFGRIAPLICFDQWFPEAARMATLAGADLLVYPTAIGVIDTDVEENITGDWEGMWRAVQVGHAAANNVHVAALNRVGREGAITFWGGTFVAGPAGELLATAKSKSEEVVVASCDFGRADAVRQSWGFLRNRRPDLYGPLTAAGSP